MNRFGKMNRLIYIEDNYFRDFDLQSLQFIEKESDKEDLTMVSLLFNIINSDRKIFCFFFFRLLFFFSTKSEISALISKVKDICLARNSFEKELENFVENKNNSVESINYFKQLSSQLVFCEKK